MPKPMTPDEGKVFKTKHGGCKPERPDKLHKDHPLYDPTPPPPATVVPDHVKGGFVAVGTAPQQADYRAEYAAHFVNESQGGTGICTAEAALVAHQWVRYKVLKASAIRLSAGFIYYCNTRDATFTHGSGISSAIASCVTYGACLSTFYSQEYLLQHFNAYAGHVFTPDELPQPPAYADGLTRRTLKWTRLAYSRPDMNLIKLRLAAGYPVAFGIGNHAMCLFAYRDNGYPYFAMDSEMAGIDNGYGPGIRGFMENTLQQNGYDFTTIDEMDISGGVIGSQQPSLVIPNDYNFGTVLVGQNKVLPTNTAEPNRAITNISTAPVTMHLSLSGPQAAQFTINPELQVDTVLPPAGSTLVFGYYKPTAEGPASALVTITSNTPQSPQFFNMTGAGQGAVVTPPPPTPTPGPTTVTYDEIIAAIKAGTFTSVQISGLQSAVAALTPPAPAPTPTPTPTPSGIILPPAAIPKDAAGNSWTWGVFIRADLGYQLLLNGRALKTVTKAAIVGGQFRCYDQGGGGWLAYTGGPNGPFTWTNSSAP